ncbi:MAG: helix-turn-helix domain-containing protein [Bradyrhizobium sp.]
MDTEEQPDVQTMSQPQGINIDAPLVASPNQAMKALLVSRATLYTLINTGELESYTDGRSRKITVESINAYVRRRLAAESARRGRAAA